MSSHINIIIQIGMATYARLAALARNPAVYGQTLLALRALLLGCNNFEVTVVKCALLLLLLLCILTALLSDLAPTTSRLVLGCRARSVALVDNAFIGQLAAPQEFFGKVAAVDIMRSRVNGFGDELELGWEGE